MSYYNTQYLSWQSSIKRDDDDGVVRNATYLNDNDPEASTNQFYDWTAIYVDSNGTPIGGGPSIVAIDDETVVPWRLTLKVIPTSTADIQFQLSGIAIDGTTTLNLDSVTYIFHCLVKSPKKVTVDAQLRGDGFAAPPEPKITYFDVANEYVSIRTNFLELNPGTDLPSSTYGGADITATTLMTVKNHENQPFFITCPFLYQEFEYMKNPFVYNSPKYIPQVLLDIDSSQNPQYPMSKLMHALNYSSAQASGLTTKFWKLDLSELPPEHDGTEDFSKSKLVDPSLADIEYLPWLSQFNGNRLRENIYASNPGDATLKGATSVRVASTTSATLSTDFAAGQTVDGILLVTGNRILIKNQATGSQNGVYVVNSSGAPTRASDMPTGVLDISDGFTILVQEGTVNSGTIWRITNVSNPTIGTTALTFGIKQISVAAATTTAGTLGTLFDSADSIDNFELSTNDKILIKDQTTASQNGVYVVAASGAPTRVASLSDGLVLTDYVDVFVINGFANKYKIFRSDQNSITVNTGSLTFTEVAKSAYVDDVEEFLRWQVINGYWGYRAGTHMAFDAILTRYLSGTKFRTYTLDGFNLSIKVLYSEAPWAAFGRSPLLEALLEPARPAGYKLTVEVVHDARFTLNSASLGQLGVGATADPLG